MSQQLKTEGQDKTQKRLARRKQHPTAAPPLPGKLNPLPKRKRRVGNRRVAQLIQATAGQELLVHELTHVVQQDGEQLQRALTQAKEGAATGGAPSGREKAPLNFLSTALSLARLSDREAATLWGQRL